MKGFVVLVAVLGVVAGDAAVRSYASHQNFPHHGSVIPSGAVSSNHVAKSASNEAAHAASVANTPIYREELDSVDFEGTKGKVVRKDNSARGRSALPQNQNVRAHNSVSQGVHHSSPPVLTASYSVHFPAVTPVVSNVAVPVHTSAPVSVTPAVPVTSYNNIELAPVLTQHHAQDELGRYSFGYAGGPSSRSETRDEYGTVRGHYSYVDSDGKVQQQHYIADDDGFRVTAGTNLPVHRYKRSSYVAIPSATGPLGVRSHHSPTSAQIHAISGPVVSHSVHDGHAGVHATSSAHGHSIINGHSGVHGLPSFHGHLGAPRVSPLLGNPDLHGKFDHYGERGFSYGFKTGPSSLTTFGTHFDQQNNGYYNDY